MPYILPSAKHPALRLPGTTGLGLRPSLACSVGVAAPFLQVLNGDQSKINYNLVAAAGLTFN